MGALVCSSLFYLFHWIARLQVHQIYVLVPPYMSFSCAMFFSLGACSLIALQLEKKLIARSLGFLIFVSAAVDFAQNFTSTKLDLDRLLSLLFFSDHGRHFFQMAPNSSLGFVFAGVALVLLGKRQETETSVFLASSLGGLTVGLGIVSLIGHLTGAETAYTWEHFVGMSVHTASLFLVFGLAISAIALQKVSFMQRRIHVPLLLVFLLMVVWVMLYQSLARSEKNSILEITKERATAFRDHAKREVNEHAFQLTRAADAWNIQGGFPEKVWRYDTRSLLKFLSGFSEICWINQAGRGAWCTPDRTTEKNSVSPFKMRDAGDANLAFLVLPPEGPDLGFRISVPLFRNGKRDGAFEGVLHFDKMFTKDYDFSDYQLVAMWKGRELFRSSPELVDQNLTTTLDLNAWGLQLNFLVTPRPQELAKLQSKLPLIFLLIGTALAWLVAYASYLFIISRENARESQDLLAWEQAISKGSDLIFITFDQQGFIKSFNPAAEKFFEYRAEEVIDLRTPMIWLDPGEVAQRLAQVRSEFPHTKLDELQAILIKARSGLVDRGEWTFITKSKNLKKGELSIHGLRSNRNLIVGYVGIVRDVTEQREAEAKLVQSSKMASLGEMAGGIAHEINNPLTIIQGRVIRLLQLSERSEGVSLPELRDQMQIVLDTSRRIAKIVKGLGTFSRESNLDLPEPAELDLIIQDTIELCRERFSESDVLLKTPSSTDLLILCRPAQISQVLLNLLNNAFDAVLNQPEKWVEVSVDLQDVNLIQIKVTDSGSGISAEVIQKIMQPFFTTKEVGKGTGLGLSISKGIIENHGGKLYLERAHLNTCFIIELPVYS